MVKHRSFIDDLEKKRQDVQDVPNQITRRGNTKI